MEPIDVTIGGLTAHVSTVDAPRDFGMYFRRLVEGFICPPFGGSDLTLQLVFHRPAKPARLDPKSLDLLMSIARTYERKPPVNAPGWQGIQDWDERVSQVVPVEPLRRALESWRGGAADIIYPVPAGCLLASPDGRRATAYLSTGEPLFFQVLSAFYSLYCIYSVALPTVGRCILHGVGLARNGRGVIALGASGAGKTTLASLATGFLVLCDDGVVLRQAAEGFAVEASPFNPTAVGEQGHRFAFTPPGEGYPIDSIFFLRRGGTTETRPVPPRLALARILRHHVQFLKVFTPGLTERVFHMIADACRALTPLDLIFERNRRFVRLIDQTAPAEEMEALASRLILQPGNPLG